MSRYNRLYRDRSVDWSLGGLCRNTRCCIVTSRQSGCGVSRYNDCIVTGAEAWLAGVTIQSIVS